MITFIALIFASFMKIANELMVTNLKIIVDIFWTMEKLRANGGDGRNEELCLSWPQPLSIDGQRMEEAKNHQISPKYSIR